MKTAPQTNRSRPGGNLQFSLKALMLWVAALCGLFAILSRLPFVWALLSAWFLILIAAHVIGNALGTRLRDEGPLTAFDDTSGDEPPPGRPTESLPTSAATRLQERTPPGRAMFAVAGFCAALGGPLGGNALAQATGDQITTAGVVVATGSSAVICGLLAFLLTSCLTMVARCVLQGACSERAAGKPRPTI